MVDYSGSMRRDDINGARCRSDAVWTAIARDYIASQLSTLKHGVASGTYTDVISVILMSNEATTVMDNKALTWSLFNDILEFKSWDEYRPSRAGNYLPALQTAKLLLAQNKACPVSLMFMSDGKPSDNGNFADSVGELASSFGRRLSFYAIGLGIPEEEDFSVLKAMAQAATKYGCHSHFIAPTLDQMSLSNILSSLATSLTRSRTEVTDLGSGHQRAVKEVQREECDAPDDEYVTEDWSVYGPSKFTDQGKWLKSKKWDLKQDKFVDVSLDDGTHKIMNIALKRQVFGEGAERMVRKFRFMTDGEFVLEKYVAKESRFSKDDDCSSSRFINMTNNYHDSFCRTQAVSGDMAKKFNDALDARYSNRLTVLHENGMYKSGAPTISFLRCYAVQVYDNEKMSNGSYLIENQLKNTKYTKYNSNNGHVMGDNLGGLVNQMKMLDLKQQESQLLFAIGESSEEDSEDDDQSDDFEGRHVFRAIDLPQAFSHFTHVVSGEKLMVCDLQGVFSTKNNVFHLTDPVVHKKLSKHTSKSKGILAELITARKGLKLFTNLTSVMRGANT